MGILYSFPNEMIECRFDGWKIADNQNVKILFTNGEYYEGHFRNNLRNDHGTHYYENGDVYDGLWSDDKRSKSGRIKQVDGGDMQGKFIKDKLDGDVQYTDSNGNTFTSEAEKAEQNLKKRSKKSDFSATDN